MLGCVGWTKTGHFTAVFTIGLCSFSHHRPTRKSPPWTSDLKQNFTHGWNFFPHFTCSLSTVHSSCWLCWLPATGQNKKKKRTERQLNYFSSFSTSFLNFFSWFFRFLPFSALGIGVKVIYPNADLLDWAAMTKEGDFLKIYIFNILFMLEHPDLFERPESYHQMLL